MLALFRRLLRGQPLSYAERWLMAQAPMSLEWLVANKERQ